MSTRFSCTLLSVGVAFGLVTSTANASMVYWDGTGPELAKDGSAGWFTWSNGGSDNDLFGNPTLTATNDFNLTPDDFTAVGNGDTATDRLEVKLNTIEGYGYEFVTVRVVEWGTYDSMLGGSVSADMVEQVSRPVPAFPFFEVFNTETDEFSFDGEGAGQWSMTTEYTLVPTYNTAWTQLTLVLTNTLQATGGSSITKEGVDIIITPEPASIVAALAGVLLVLRRR